MSAVRLRRLTADNAKLQDYVRRHPRVRLVQASGDPPERYQFEYRIKSLRMVDGELQTVPSHVVEIALPLNYPRTPPQCRMLSPVFHPNIAPHAICVGDHWGAGESLESIVIRIGEMLAYQSYNVKSPLNGEAARWVEQNKHLLPLDPVSLLPEEDRDGGSGVFTQSATSASTATKPIVEQPLVQLGQQREPAVVAPSPAPLESPPVSNSPAAQIIATCPKCSARYRVSSTLSGRSIRCNKCGESFQCQPTDVPPPAGIGET